MELSHLRNFTAIVRCGSVSEAARRIGVSQPSLSAQVHQLERHFGRRLFDRSARGVRLTPAGDRLLRSCRRIVDEMGIAEAALRAEEYGEPPTLHLGVQPMFGGLLAQAAGKLLAERPDTRLTVREGPSATLVDLVLAEEVELGLLALPARLPSAVEAKVISRSRYSVLVPRGHPLMKRRRVGAVELHGQFLAVLRGPSEVEEKLAHLASRSGRRVRVAIRTDQASTVLEMAAAGVALGVLPNLLVEKAAAMGLVHVPLDLPGLEVRVGTVWRKDHPQSDVATRFLAGLAACAPEPRR
jgi:DNA-binding transcriptional LysR family regulator